MLKVSVPTPSNSPAPVTGSSRTSGGKPVVVQRFIAAGYNFERPMNPRFIGTGGQLQLIGRFVVECFIEYPLCGAVVFGELS